MFTYVDERDYRAAKAEEDRQVWSRSAEGQAQLADLAAKDAVRHAANAKRQIEMMETEAGRAELAKERKLKVAEYVSSSRRDAELLRRETDGSRSLCTL